MESTGPTNIPKYQNYDLIGMVTLSYVATDELTPDHKSRVKELQSECFGSANKQKPEEVFIAESFGMVFAWDDEMRMIGLAELFTRRVSFEGKEILLGGVGGACVTSSRRNEGIGKRLMSKSSDILREKRCDVACLAANADSRRLYLRLGFKDMKRKVSFEDVNGRLRYSGSEMFSPLGSYELFELIMKSDKTLHMGRGLW